MVEPCSELVVDGHAEQPALQAAIKAACRTLLPGWAALEDAELEVSFVTGGISNALFKVAPSSAQGPAPVVFRIYGDNTEAIIDRQHEMANMRLLHRHGFGPQLLATFANGRIEQCLPMRCLQPEEMASPEFAPAIAETLARFHATPAPGAPPAGQAPRTPFRRLQEWLDTAEGFHFQDPEKQASFERFDFGELRREAAAAEAACAAAASPPAFCHNDLLSGNIMVAAACPYAAATAAAAATDGRQQQGQEQEQRCRGQPYASRPLAPAVAAAVAAGAPGADGAAAMTFIDFEYSGWAPRGFDLGNHFCEYAGNDCDYSRYPGQEQAALFVRHYLAAAAAGEAPSEAAVARCVAEANAFALAAHMYWGTWGLLQAKWSSIDFDYMLFARSRWDEYFRRKDEFLSAAAAAFGGGERG